MKPSDASNGCSPGGDHPDPALRPPRGAVLDPIVLHCQPCGAEVRVAAGWTVVCCGECGEALSVVVPVHRRLRL